VCSFVVSLTCSWIRNVQFARKLSMQPRRQWSMAKPIINRAFDVHIVNLFSSKWIQSYLYCASIDKIHWWIVCSCARVMWQWHVEDLFVWYSIRWCLLIFTVFSRPGNFTANDGKIYCKTHYMQLFKVKGNYKSGFAGETNLTVDTGNNNSHTAHQ
jgi:hypothetical protein